ncbi:MAG: PD40 domain-containing protein [Candidatus Eremiobacteraeota bacterium]|nr:PD40 domain-containing protein [Candidatus Eremiobacteraeota bacterium]
MTTNKYKFAFSLIELIVAVGIVVVLGALSFANLGGAQKRAKARGMADILAEEMRATRRRAMAKGYPVAMVFPTDGGATPCTRTFYILEGRERGEFFRSRTLGNELADAFAFVGSYNGGESVGDPPTGDVADTLDPVDWLPAGFSDNALIFTPTGRVRSNGLPVFDSNFHVLTALDVDYSGSTASSATEPYSITISPVGGISVETGAAGLSSPADGSLPTIASTLPSSTTTNSGPTISNLKLLPTTNDDIYSSDVHGVSESYSQLYPEQGNSDGMTDFAPISINLTATDPDGDQLFCRFSSSPDQGDFSVTGDANGWAPMTWDPTSGEWQAYTTFLIPPTAVQGESWDIEAEITDGETIVSSSGSFSRTLRSASGKGKIAFDKRLYDDATGDWNDAVYAMNLDGTGVRKVTDVLGVNENNPDWSPDGVYLAFSSTVNGDLNTADIYISTADGRYIYNITDSPGADEQFPVFSPDGNRIAFLVDGNGDGNYGLKAQNIRSGATPVKLANDITSSSSYPASWDPTGEFLCYAYQEPGANSLVIQAFGSFTPQYRRIDGQDPGAQGTVDDANGLRWDVKEAKWCNVDKNGHGEIIFRADNDGDGKCGLYLLAVNPLNPLDSTGNPIYQTDTDLNAPVELLPESEDVISMAFAPGGNKIAAACDPTTAGAYKVKVLYMDHASWPPTISSTEVYASGRDNFRPRFTSNGNIVIVQSAKGVDRSYKLFRIPVWSGATIGYQLLTHKSKDVISHSNSR